MEKDLNICLFLQRSFVRFGHSLAINIKNKNENVSFCAYVHLKNSYNFLKNQSEINYSPVLLDEDVHKEYKNEILDFEFLKKLEEEYGIPNLWPYLAIDRTLMYSILPREYPSDKPMYSHEDMMRILQVKARSIIKLLEKEKPECIIFSVIGSTSSLLLYHVAKKMQIKTFVFYLPGISNLLSITEEYNRLNLAERKFERIKSGDHKSSKRETAKNFITAFRKNPSPYHENASPKKTILRRLKYFKFIKPINFIGNVKWVLKVILNKNRGYADEKPLFYLIDKIKRKFREIRGYADLYDNTKEEDFCFFPLNAEPEIALYLWAPFRQNQIEIARHIAKSLPLHFKLYIKDHPTMYGYRTRKFYKELKKIPNVKLINSRTESFNLINKAKLVTTITGTAGWEATVLKKPVISFGDVYYNKLSMVKKCSIPEELPTLVKEQLENFKYDEEEIIDFLSAIMEESINLNFIDLWHKERDMEKMKSDSGIKELANFIAQKIGLNKLQ